MNDKQSTLTEKLRRYVYKFGTDFSDDHLQQVGTTREEIFSVFRDNREIVRSILAKERDCFEDIFKEYNFDGWNAIDILLLVGNEIFERFFQVSPSITCQLAEDFPDLYEEHLDARAAFIFDKIKINIEKGMQQGMYKNDVSSEMVSRMYIAKLNDIHNTDIYPPEGFGFATIFNNLIDDVIRSITNEEGWNYYKQRKQLYAILNYNR